MHNILEYLTINCTNGRWRSRPLDDEPNCTFTSQRTNNTNPESNNFKIQRYDRSTYIDLIKVQTTLGTGYVSFVKQSSWNKLNIAFNGNVEDATAMVNCISLKNGETYTLTYNITTLDRTNTGNEAAVDSLVLTKGSTPIYLKDIKHIIAIGNDDTASVSNNPHVVMYAEAPDSLDIYYKSGIFYDKDIAYGAPTYAYASKILGLTSTSYTYLKAIKLYDLNKNFSVASGNATIVKFNTFDMNQEMTIWLDDFIREGDESLDEMAIKYDYDNWTSMCEAFCEDPLGVGANPYKCNPALPSSIFTWNGHNYFIWLADYDNGPFDMPPYVLTNFADYPILYTHSLENICLANDEYNFLWECVVACLEDDFSEYKGWGRNTWLVKVELEESPISILYYCGFKALTNSSIKFDNGSSMVSSDCNWHLQYSFDGETWSNFATSYINVPSGKIIYIKQDTDNYGNARGNQGTANWARFYMNGSFQGVGYLSSIIDGLNSNINKTIPSISSYIFYGLFKGCTALTQAPLINYYDITEHCYDYMFDGCTSLQFVETYQKDFLYSGNPPVISPTLTNYLWLNNVYSIGRLTVHLEVMPGHDGAWDTAISVYGRGASTCPSNWLFTDSTTPSPSLL